MSKVTKQGVRNLDTKPQKHVHKYTPRTFTNRGGFQVTTMQCWCGDEQRANAGANAAYEDRDETSWERSL